MGGGHTHIRIDATTFTQSTYGSLEVLCAGIIWDIGLLNSKPQLNTGVLFQFLRIMPKNNVKNSQ